MFLFRLPYICMYCTNWLVIGWLVSAEPLRPIYLLNLDRTFEYTITPPLPFSPSSLNSLSIITYRKYLFNSYRNLQLCFPYYWLRPPCSKTMKMIRRGMWILLGEWLVNFPEPTNYELYANFSVWLKIRSTQKPQYSKIAILKIGTFEISANFSASPTTQRGSSIFLKGDLISSDNYLFHELKNIFTTICFFEIAVFELLSAINFSNTFGFLTCLILSLFIH